MAPTASSANGGKIFKSRDYYIAKRGNGQLLWIFYDRVQSRWFLHGLFG